jgi:hypothetical protein
LLNKEKYSLIINVLQKKSEKIKAFVKMAFLSKKSHFLTNDQ